MYLVDDNQFVTSNTLRTAEYHFTLQVVGTSVVCGGTNTRLTTSQ